MILDMASHGASPQCPWLTKPHATEYQSDTQQYKSASTSSLPMWDFNQPIIMDIQSNKQHNL